MSYLVIARKYRPQRFQEVIGQEHISQTLKNAIRLGKISHAYLFTGPRGVGKTTTARILAKALNCTSGKDEEPCNSCQSCREITSCVSIDVMEIDAASNGGVDDARQLREKVMFAPAAGKYRVYIIDEVHMLSNSAFNALLKTLEEPPPHAVFIMATTEPEKVLETIKSRCQSFSFKLISEKKIAETLRKIAEDGDVKYEEEGLMMLARAARGSMRDAESLMDQALSYSGGELQALQVSRVLGLVPRDFLFEYTEYIRDNSVREAILLTGRLVRDGFSVNRIFSELQSHFRNLMYATVFGAETGFMGFGTEYAGKLAAAAESFSREQLVWITEFLTANTGRMKYAEDPHIVIDTIIFKLCQKYVSYEELKGLIDSGTCRSEKNVKNASPPVQKPVNNPKLTDDRSNVQNISNNGRNRDAAAPPETAEPDFPTQAGPAKKPSRGKKWSAILNLVEKDAPSLFHTLNESKVDLKENAIIINWKSSLDVTEKQMNILKSRITEVMGEGFYPDVRKISREPAAAAAPEERVGKPRRTRPADIEEKEPLVRKIVSEFKGRIEKTEEDN